MAEKPTSPLLISPAQCTHFLSFLFFIVYLFLLQVTQPVGYIKLCRAHNVIKSMAEWTARDCYVSLLVASLPFSSIKLLRNCPNFLKTDIF
jgi:hypothetical protein